MEIVLFYFRFWVATGLQDTYLKVRQKEGVKTLTVDDIFERHHSSSINRQHCIIRLQPLWLRACMVAAVRRRASTVASRLLALSDVWV